MGRRYDQDSDVQRVQRLLDELCIRLGFCLPPDEQRRLRESPPAEAESFTDAIFEAEGMVGMYHKQLRRQIREVVDQHMSRWVEAGYPGSGETNR